jgi:GAF domain-containing protein
MGKGKSMTMPDTNKHNAELVILHEVGQLLTVRLTVDDVLDAIYQGVSRLLDATNFYVIFHDTEKHELTFTLRVEDGKMERPSIIQPFREGGLNEYVITSKQPLLIHDLVDERLTTLGIRGRQIHPKRPTVSWLGVPIIAADQVIGAMAVQSYNTSKLYTEEDRDLLMVLADQAAIAIVNIRQFDQMQRELSEWSGMYKETQHLHEELEDRVKALNDELAFAYEEIQRLSKQVKNT